MRKLKDWLYKRFLPFETKDIYLRDLEAERAKSDKLRRENEELKAYIEGLRFALRCQRKIEIKNEVTNGAED